MRCWPTAERLPCGRPGKRGVVFVDGLPITPCFEQPLALALVLEDVCQLLDQFAQLFGACVEEREEAFDELRRRYP